MKLMLMAVLGLLSPPHRDHTEIYVVSCDRSWIDLDGARHRTRGPVWAYTLEHDADTHVQFAPGCEYTHVLLEPAR